VADTPPLDEPVDDELEVVLVEVVDVLVVVVPEDDEGGVAALVVGTVSVGTERDAGALEPPPQALRTAAEATAATVARANRELRGMVGIGSLRCRPPVRLGGDRVELTAARGADGQILLRKLVAMRAEAKVLERPRQLRGRWRQRRQLRDYLELLARLGIDVMLPRLSLDD
jgi:hypothetical protein